MQNSKNVFSLPISKQWLTYLAELLVVVFGVFLGFMANNYTSNLQEKDYINATIKQMYLSLENDISDAQVNLNGHNRGLNAIPYFFKIAKGEPVNVDSFEIYHHRLTRTFISVQNTSQFETIRSKGFNVIKNDSLRRQMIKLYDFEYEVLEKIEEKYQESQLFAYDYLPIINLLDKSLVFGNDLKLVKIQTPLNITQEERSQLILILKRMHTTRVFNIGIYRDAIKKMEELRAHIAKVYPFVLKK